MSNKFALIGCGGMGFRHLLGYIEYLKYDNELDLVALVDNNDASALYLSDHLFKNTKKKVDRFKKFYVINYRKYYNIDRVLQKC